MLWMVVALDCEARPLIERFRLESGERVGGFRTHVSERIGLVVSATGRVNASAATALAGSRARGETTAFLNVGIGGHRDLDIGSPCLAHRIEEEATGKTWYPVFTSRPTMPSESVLTVDRPRSDYPSDAVLDMEASAFFATATRFSTAELVAVVKIIADNAERPIDVARPDAARVRELIGDHVDLVDRLVEPLLEVRALVAKLEASPPGLEEVAGRLRASVTERRRLRELVRRFVAVRGGVAGSDRDALAEAVREHVAGCRSVAEAAGRLAATVGLEGRFPGEESGA